MTVTIALNEPQAGYLHEPQNDVTDPGGNIRRNDLLYKGILEDLFDDFLRFMIPNADERIDMQRGFEFLNKELEQLFPPEENIYQPRIIDQLVKIYTRDGKEEWILLHLEIQDRYSSDFSERMFRYFIRIYDKYQRPISAYAILTEASSIVRSNIFSLSCLGTKVDYTFNMFKMATQDEAQLENSENPFAKVVLIAKAALQGKALQEHARDTFLLEVKTKLARHLLSQSMHKNKIRILINFLKYHIRFTDNRNNTIFEQRLDEITERSTTMGIEEQIIDLATKEGVKQGKLQTAREMKADGQSDELIAKYTKLSIEEIKNLK
ncbi:hypothetical protein [Pedobacter sp. JY14-1]|uniref:hypothetical protein n=1 Tax=Pedobacter sp. JY14-1 TaxID=3034151 RepID=UPI0023E27707|nr:hypothetical protein [Pedobacter sp. JY14-1]